MIVLILTAPLWAEAPGEITGVKLEPEHKSIIITAKGTVGKHWGRVIGQPNRLVLDFSDTQLGQVPAKISGNDAIHEIRLGQWKSRARLVVDFQKNPVPPFKVQREGGRIVILLGKSLAEGAASREKTVGLNDWKRSAGASPATPLLVPAAARSSQDEASAAPTQAPAAADQNRNPRSLVTTGKTIQVRPGAPAPVLNNLKVAQNVEPGKPAGPMPAPGASSQDQGGIPRHVSAAPPRGPSGGPQMVREVRPPVTPPTPDPRLLVQEITELQFIQVGHNARLVVRGGDHLDYRMNKVSPTKLKLDLINAEIPKVYQKPLKTDLFSTSVEMIVPGSQTIFIQLKDAVPYQVEKKKGVLMIDFPPPRFEMTRDQLGTLKPGAGDQAGREAASQMRETRREAVRIMKEEEIVRANESRTKDIQALQRQQEELQKQRTEIIKRYQISPDPEIFNKPVTMDFQGISLRNAFRLLAEQAGINIIVGNEVSGTTTLRLFQVPLGQVIETILNTHGLDREMVGNVMRVGLRTQIAQYKAQRQQEYQRRIGEVDRRLKEIAEQVSKKQAENDKMLKELERKEARAEEAADETRTEEVGEAECIDMDGERVCFQYATIRMVYRVPSSIVPTLNCVFNLQCGPGSRGRQQYAVTSSGVIANPSLDQTFGAAGASAARGDIQTLQASQAGLQQRQTMGSGTYAADLSAQGFQPGSPGFEARMETQRRLQERQESTEARAQVAAAQSQMATGRGGRATIDLPFGTDPRLARILAQSILWADDTNRILYIKDTPERIAQMKKLIYQLDIPIPQVLIESRLVQATRDWSRGVGIIWGGRTDQSGYLSGFKQNFWGLTGGAAAGTPGTITQGAPAPPQPQGTLITPNFMVNLPAVAGSLMGATLQYGFLGSNYLTELDFRLQLGEANGQTKVIARPKVQVLDGQPATIKNGRTIAYQTVSADGTQTQLVPVDLLLSVTPTIFADGRIRMVIKVTDNDVGGIVNGVSEILTREASTIMIVKDGETAVIGGTIRKTDNETKNGWPGLMNVPGINFLFSNKNRSKQITELLVFVTPTVIRRPPTAS